MPQQSKVFSGDGTIFNTEPPCATGRQGKRNILRTKRGTKRFILTRVNDEKDVFQELWGRQNLENVMHFSFAEARKEGDEALSLSKDKFTAFFGRYILRGVLKERDEPLFHFWDEEYGRLIFQETMSRNKFKSIRRYIRFDDKNSRSLRRQTDKFAAIRELMIQSWITAKSHIFLVQMSQLMSNFSRVEQDNLSKHLIIYCGVTQ